MPSPTPTTPPRERPTARQTARRTASWSPTANWATPAFSASTVQVDTFGYIQQVSDSYGSIWTMTYDGSQDLQTIDGPNGISTNTYTYNTTLASPMNHEMSHVTNPDGDNTAIAYSATGMANALVSPAGGTTSYTYTNTACATTAGCVAAGIGQNSVVNYPDRENDYDNYVAGVLQSDSFGHGTSSGSSMDQPGGEIHLQLSIHAIRVDDRDRGLADSGKRLDCH